VNSQRSGEGDRQAGGEHRYENGNRGRGRGRRFRRFRGSGAGVQGQGFRGGAGTTRERVRGGNRERKEVRTDHLKGVKGGDRGFQGVSGGGFQGF